MEDVRPIHMDHHARLGVPLGVAVAGDVRALVEHLHREPRLRQFTGDHRAREAGAHDGDGSGGRHGQPRAGHSRRSGVTGE